MTRRESREHIIKLLYMRDYHEKDELEEENSLYFENFAPLGEDDMEFVISKYEKISGKLGEIDPVIDKAAKGWKLNRIGKVELCILRLAVYEILFDESVPGKVAVNEAIELAKIYSGGASGSFINGVLAGVIKEP